MAEKHAGGSMKFIGGPLDGKEYTGEVTASVLRFPMFGNRRLIRGGDLFGRDMMTTDGLAKFNASGTPPIDFAEYSVVEGSLVHKLTERFYKSEAYADQAVVL